MPVTHGVVIGGLADFDRSAGIELAQCEVLKSRGNTCRAESLNHEAREAGTRQRRESVEIDGAFKECVDRYRAAGAASLGSVVKCRTRTGYVLGDTVGYGKNAADRRRSGNIVERAARFRSTLADPFKYFRYSDRAAVCEF